MICLHLVTVEENVVDDPGGFVNSVSQSVSRLGLFYNQVLTATATVGNMGINVGNAVVVNFVSSEGELINLFWTLHCF